MDNNGMHGRKDLEMICISCGKRFVFSAGEQAYYKEKKLCFPKRCRNCRGQNRSGERVPTIIGKKNAVKEFNFNSGYNNICFNNSKASDGNKCRNCAIGNSDACPKPVHNNNSNACDAFVSKKILTEDMKKNFPAQGKATYLKYGKTGKSQFKRAKYESE